MQIRTWLKPSKQTGRETTMKVATHNGVFHADDACAIAALRHIHTVEVVRTRDPKVLEAADMRVDVGGEYDHEKRTYDHHQRDGAGLRENGAPYAAFGLIWKHYGLDVVNSITGTADPIIAQKVEERLVIPVDAGDNGVEMTEGGIYRFKTLDGKKEVRNFTLGHVISDMNPSWHEENQNFDSEFRLAIDLADRILVREILRAQGVTLAETRVRDAIAKMEGQIITLEQFCPWQDVVIPEAPEALFVVYPSVEGDWMVQCIPPEIGSFGQRKGLPEAWAGKRDTEIQELTGVKTAIFTHPARFIGGAKTREDALAMARLAVAE